MLTHDNLHEYQGECVTHMLENPNAMLWLQMGLGKTIITLTSIVSLQKSKKINKTIIFGPLRVIESVWTTEAEKWEHTKHLTFSTLRGNAKERETALNKDADIYLINYEQMNWLAKLLFTKYTKKKIPLPFQCVIYDEVSKLKNSASLRVKGGNRDRKDKDGNYNKVTYIGWRKLIESFHYRYGLTGTPASNGYLDLHGQFLAVDAGVRLGVYITHYKEAYFSKSYDGWTYTITDTGKHWIEKRIADITLKMDSKDYLDMPAVWVTDIRVDLPPKVLKAYGALEKEFFTELDSGVEIEVDNAASLSNKCLQFCNGAPYTNVETREWEALHEVKIEALKDILEEAAGAPVLCSYTFKSDAERIMKYFSKYKPVNLTKEASNKTKSIIKKWNEGKIKLMIGHPGSMSHGIDGLQYSGSIIVWFGLSWSLELYEQMNARINRQGQTKPVSIIRILCNDTIDLAVADKLEQKDNTQEGIKDSIARYRVPDFY